MSGQFSASLSFDELPERISTPPTLGQQVGILLHLACIALVGTAIIVVFFGIAFSLLRHPTGEGIANSGARDRHMAPAEAKLAPTLSVVPPRSAPMPPAGEATTSAASLAPLRADLPTSVATLPGTTPATTAFAAAEPGSTQLSTMGTQPDKRMRPNAIGETPGV
jgi:hypothetical protein